MRLSRKGFFEAVVTEKRRSIRPQDEAQDNDGRIEAERSILDLSREARRLSSFILEDQVQLFKMWLDNLREKNPSLADEIFFLLSGSRDDKIVFRGRVIL
jgi:hypothetical protein